MSPSPGCQRTFQWILEREADTNTPDDVAQHLLGCERCAELALAMDKAAGQEAARFSPAGSAVAVSQPELDEIKSTILTHLSPVRPLPAIGVLFALLLLILSTLLAIGIVILGADGWHARMTTARAGVFLPLLVSVCLLGLAAVRQMTPGSGSIDGHWKGSLAMFGAAAGAAALVFGPREEEEFLHTGIHCISLSLASAAVASAAVWVLIRRGAVLSPPLTGMLAGGIAGLVTVAMAEIRCPNLNVFHILLWHMPTAAIIAGLGVAIGLVARNFSRRRN